MLALKYLLMTCGVGMIMVAVGILAFDLYREILSRRALGTPEGAAIAVVVRWRLPDRAEAAVFVTAVDVCAEAVVLDRGPVP